MNYPIEYTQGSGAKPYETKVNPNGLLGCTCAGWTIKRAGKPRYCKHCVAYVAKHGLQVEERDGQMFVVNGSLAAPGKPVAWVETKDGARPADEFDAPAAIIPDPAAKKQNGFIDPMLASKMPTGADADNYAGKGYVMEEKFDGHRMVVAIQDGQVRAWSRLENARTMPKHVAAQLARLPNGVYDGELIVPGKHSYDVAAGQNAGTEVLVLFDVLEVLGTSVMNQPLSTRRAYLETALGALSHLTAVGLVAQQEPSMQTVRQIWARGGEGAIIKRLSSTYRPGYRTGDWVKVKAQAAATVTITGYKAGESGPYSTVTVIDDEGNKSACKTRDAATLRLFAANPQAYIGRRLVVTYQERTPDGNYRHIIFDHLAGEAE